MKRFRYKIWSQITTGLGAALCLIAIPACVAETAKNWELVVTSNLPSGVALVGEPAEYRFAVRRRSAAKRTVQLSVEIQAPGDKGRRESWTLSFEGEGTQEKTLTLSTTERGYWSLLATVSDNDRPLAQKQSALAVVEKPRNFGRFDPGSFFGSMFNRVPEAGEKIGIKYERQMTVWNWLSPAEGVYTWETLDARLELLSRHHVSVVLVILMEKPPKWAKWNSFEELARPENLPYFEKYVRDVAERYRGRIAGIEVLNEPDLECAKGLRGAIPATRIYATLLKTAYQAVKSVAPEMPVLGVDVSGMDFPRLRFAEDVLTMEPTSLDIIAGHPYASTRYLGGGAVAESPDQINSLARFADMASLMKKHGLKPRVWPTEFGWGLHKDELMASSATELWAAYAAQAIATARSVPEVEKLFWFSTTFPGYEGQFTYGMFQGDRDNYYPSPAVPAYATCARFLDEVRFVRPLALGTSGKGLRFANTRNGDGIFVLWLSDPRSVGGEIQISLPTVSFSGVEVNDGFGRNQKGDLAIHAMPLFLRVPGDNSDQFEKYLQSAPQRARETLLVERVYLTETSHILTDIVNNSGSPVSIKLLPKDHPELGRSTRLAMGASTVALSLSTPLQGKGQMPLELLLEATGTKKVVPFDYELISVAKRTQVKIDGRLDEVKGLKSQVRNTREEVYPRDPGVEWNGAKDLSMEVWVAWTAEGLYLAAKVADDVATESVPDDAFFWKQDSLQIAWDMGNRAESGYDRQCLELGVYRTSAGTSVFQIYPESKPIHREDLLLASQRVEGAAVYEMLIPWRMLGVSEVASGRVFRLNIIANDNDGPRRKCWIGLSPGIGEGKHPSAFPHWVLDDSP